VFRLILNVIKVTIVGLKFVSKNGSVSRLDEVQDKVRVGNMKIGTVNC
jgi:hypothetical protein